MAVANPVSAPSRLSISSNEAVARGVWDAGCAVASASFPRTQATESLDLLPAFSDLHVQWSTDEASALRLAIDAASAGMRSFCVVKALDFKLVSAALTALVAADQMGGGLVIAVTDDVSALSWENAHDSRRCARLLHLPILEPADPQEAYELSRHAFALSEEFVCPVILRMSTPACRVEGLVSVGERVTQAVGAVKRDSLRRIAAPSDIGAGSLLMLARERELCNYANQCEFNVYERGKNGEVGFLTSGPAYFQVREAFPDAPIFRLGMSYPLPMNRVRGLVGTCRRVVVVEAGGPLIEGELKAEGLKLHGKDVLSALEDLAPSRLCPAVARLLAGPSGC